MSLARVAPPERLEGERLVLEPLRVEHADEMAPLLEDATLHTFIGGEPASHAQLAKQYTRQVEGWSGDRTERWFNWIARESASSKAVGYVQATVTEDEDRLAADVAWVIAAPQQGRGYAREAAKLMTDWLRGQGVELVTAHVHPKHDASGSIARGIGLSPTDTLVDGEVRWSGPTKK